MRHYIQYHNPDRFGSPLPPQEGVFSVMTRKQPYNLPGAWVWLVGGEGRPRRYFLRRVFLVDFWQPVEDPDFWFRLAGALGVHFQPSLELTGYPWFERMKRQLANFSLGLTEVTGSYAPYLVALARQKSPDYLLFESRPESFL